MNSVLNKSHLDYISITQTPYSHGSVDPAIFHHARHAHAHARSALIPARVTAVDVLLTNCIKIVFEEIYETKLHLGILHSNLAYESPGFVFHSLSSPVHTLSLSLRLTAVEWSDYLQHQ